MTDRLTIDPPSADQARGPQARKTLAAVATGMENQTVIGMAEIARLIETLTVDGLKISVQELAETIEKDVIVTAKILKSANLLCHNQTFIDIESIEDAIKIIGFNKIRNLALSLLLMENLRRPGAAKVHRQAATVALTTSLLTQAWARIQDREDAEYAFLYASLRQFGHLLLAAYLPEDYARARAETPPRGDFAKSCQKIFGLTAHEVGVEHLKSMQFPPALLTSLQPYAPDPPGSARSHPGNHLLLASEMSRQMADLILDDTLAEEAYQEGMLRVRTTFQEALRISPETLRAMFTQTEQRFELFGQSFGISGVARGLSRRFSTPCESPSASPAHATPPHPARTSDSVPPCPETAAAPAKAATAEPAPNFFIPAASAPSKLDIVMEAIAEVGNRLSSAGDSRGAKGLTDLLRQTLELCWKPDHVHLFRENARGVYSLSSDNAPPSAEAAPAFTPGERSVFGLATGQNECVRIHDSFDPLIRPHLPAWFKPKILLRSCFIVPAGEQPGRRMVVCFGWLRPGLVSVNPAEIRALRILLGLIANAR